MPTEADLTAYPATNPDVAYVITTGNEFAPGARVGLWTVPDGVESFSAYIVAGMTAHAGDHPGVLPPVFLYNVPTEPGDVWALEAGDPESYVSPIFTPGANSYSGGDGGGGGGGSGTDGYGFAGAGASLLSRRRAGEELLFVMLGGEGGQFEGGTSPAGYPGGWPTDPGPTVTGPPTALPGSATAGEDGIYLEAGGGGGWPGGAASPSLRTWGFSGGNYVPVGEDFDGPRSPTWAETGFPFSPPAPPAPDAYRITAEVRVWYYAPEATSSGWIVGSVGVG